MFVEIIYGYLTNSLGLISDAAHMCFDCTALLIGLIASYISKLEIEEGYSYGLGRIEVLSGFFNAIFLIFVAFKVFCESIDRIFEPEAIEQNGLLTVSILGFLVNVVGLLCFHDLHQHECSHDHDTEYQGVEGQDHESHK
jgi:zinc transporter 5/7